VFDGDKTHNDANCPLTGAVLPPTGAVFDGKKDS
jgi:hypothetical protein